MQSGFGVGVRGISVLLPLAGIVLLFLFVGIMVFIFIVTRGGRKQREIGVEETRMMQEIYHRLTEFEDRIETLETLLIKRDGKDVTR